MDEDNMLMVETKDGDVDFVPSCELGLFQTDPDVQQITGMETGRSYVPGCADNWRRRGCKDEGF